MVAGELLEPLGEPVGGEPLPEPLEPFARLAAEEEALGRLLPLRLVGRESLSAVTTVSWSSAAARRVSRSAAFSRSASRSVVTDSSSRPSRAFSSSRRPDSSLRRAISAAEEALRADRERKRTTAAITATAATARATSSPVDKGAPPRERNGATGDFTSGRGRAGMRSRPSGSSPRRR